MMNGVSLETCWAIKKHWNNKFYYTVASCWLFLYDLYYDALIHEHQIFYYLWNFTSWVHKGVKFVYIKILKLYFNSLIAYIVSNRLWFYYLNLCVESFTEVSEIHFNNIITYIPTFPKWPFLWPPPIKMLHLCLISPNACHMLYHSHSLWLRHPNATGEKCNL
jgi:hypothetical protein